MTKNDIAKKITGKYNLCRTMAFYNKQDFRVGDLYDNWGRAESWSDEDCTYGFCVENQTKKYKYVFMCENVPGHKVDYSNFEETEILAATGCESESEVIVPADTKMRIVYVSSDEDFEEMGFYCVDLELI